MEKGGSMWDVESFEGLYARLPRARCDVGEAMLGHRIVTAVLPCVSPRGVSSCHSYLSFGFVI